MISKRERNWIVILGVYFIVLACNIVTPLISDDFTYQKLGFDLTAKFNHYIGWSGRIVADFISSAILQLPDRSLMSFFNALPVVIIIFFSVLIGVGGSEKQEKGLSTSALMACFSSYIIFNPALGQTTFWVVGAANYLWTSMLCLAYMLMFYRLYDGKKDNPLFLAILSLLAGCTNESSSATLAGMSVILVIYFWMQHKELLYRSLVMSTSFIVGAAILILAPGNRKRMSVADFSEWRSMNFYGHIKLHFLERLPANSIPIIYSFLFIAMLLFLVFASRIKISKQESIKYIAIPIFLSLGMAFVMFLSPYFPPRSLNMSLVVNLIPIGFLVAQLTTKIRVIISVASLSALVYFLPSIYIALSHGLI